MASRSCCLVFFATLMVVGNAFITGAGLRATFPRTKVAAMAWRGAGSQLPSFRVWTKPVAAVRTAAQPAAVEQDVKVQPGAPETRPVSNVRQLYGHRVVGAEPGPHLVFLACWGTGAAALGGSHALGSRPDCGKHEGLGLGWRGGRRREAAPGSEGGQLHPQVRLASPTQLRYTRQPLLACHDTLSSCCSATGWPDWVILMVISALPVVELRGGVPVGLWMGIPPAQTFALACLGNFIPVPFILSVLNSSQWLREKVQPRLEKKLKEVTGAKLNWQSLVRPLGANIVAYRLDIYHRSPQLYM